MHLTSGGGDMSDVQRALVNTIYDLLTREQESQRLQSADLRFPAASGKKPPPGI